MSANTNRPNMGLLVAIIVVVTALLAVGGYVIAMMTPWLMGPQVSTQAVQVDGLMYLMMFIGGMIFLLVQGAIVYAVIFFRAKKGDTTDGPHIHGSFALEFIWTLIPVIIVFVLTIYSYIVFVDTRAPKVDEVTVKVTAQRFNFGFEYQDPVTGELINDSVLRTYVGQDVRLEMNAVDVIHAFWIPSMRVKQDTIPGRVTEMRFTPTVAGRYPVVCTELCGGGHGGMRSEVLVYPDEASYMEWNSALVDCKLNPPEDPAQRGYTILSSGVYPCAGCHQLDTITGWVGVTGPALNGIADRADDRAVAAGNADAADYLHTSIRNSATYLVPGYSNLMPIFGEEQMSEADLNDIVAYLLTQGADAEPLAPACETPAFDDVMMAWNNGAQSVASR
ncbi:MAG: cytochrome c oxidase subunit II [Phototrophicaceae bacterium]